VCIIRSCRWSNILWGCKILILSKSNPIRPNLAQILSQLIPNFPFILPKFSQIESILPKSALLGMQLLKMRLHLLHPLHPWLLRNCADSSKNSITITFSWQEDNEETKQNNLVKAYALFIVKSLCRFDLSPGMLNFWIFYFSDEIHHRTKNLEK